MSRRKSNEEDMNAMPMHLSYRLREGLLILTSALAVFLLIALVSFHRSDAVFSSMSQPMHNLEGHAGAWVADFFLFIFGYLAYLFPLMIIWSAWIFFRASADSEDEDFVGKAFSLRAAGFIFILAAGSGIASLHFNKFYAHVPLSAGGILGDFVGFGLASILNNVGGTLVLLALFCSGLTLFTGLSWFWLMDSLGAITLILFEYVGLLTQKLLHMVRYSYQIRRTEKSHKKEPELTPIKIANKKSEPSLKITTPLITATPKKSTVPAESKSSARTARERIDYINDVAVTGALPSIDLLDPPEPNVTKGYSHEQLEMMSREVEIRLKDFGIEVQVVAVHPGPVITRFELQLAAGIKVSRISSLAKDLARSLSVVSVRIVEVIQGKSVVGLELPNEDRETVHLSEILSSPQYVNIKSPLTLALGKDIAGNPVLVDLAKMPHLLVAGTTGSGKSVGVNAMLIGLLYKSQPTEVRLIMVDPKMLELSVYEGIPHLLTPVVTDMKQAANALRWCVAEMERRYKLMATLGVRNLIGFNTKIREAIKSREPIPDPFWQGDDETLRPSLTTLPFIVVIIDEFADMMMVVGKKVEQLIARIAQKARAAGIHLILATQRPSVDVITGLIKANIPTRIAYQVSSKIDSRTVIDQAGAEQLLGQGDMLYLPPGTSVPVRVHGAFVADDEVHRVVKDWKNRGKPEYIDEITSSHVDSSSNDGESGGFASEDDDEHDEFYDQAVHFVTKTRKVSISSIQRRFKIGYNRAARLVEDMENQGVVSGMESNGSREVLAPPPQED